MASWVKCKPMNNMGRLSSTYGDTRTNGGTHGHGANDYAVPVGTPVYAVQDGHAYTGGDKSYGNVITIVDSKGRGSRYAHLSKIIKTGNVKAGQLIGKSGATGNVTGPHLHFEIRLGGKRVNPSPYLNGKPFPKNYHALDVKTVLNNPGKYIKNEKIKLSSSKPSGKDVYTVKYKLDSGSTKTAGYFHFKDILLKQYQNDIDEFPSNADFSKLKATLT